MPIIRVGVSCGYRPAGTPRGIILDSALWFVSMECLFSGFDYCLKDNSGATRVVARNSSTAFLTKHLRAYGGTGQYGDSRVGRVLRNIVFSGKGLVRNPANPESVILAEPEGEATAYLSSAVAAWFSGRRTRAGDERSNPVLGHDWSSPSVMHDSAVLKKMSLSQAQIDIARCFGVEN